MVIIYKEEFVWETPGNCVMESARQTTQMKAFHFLLRGGKHIKLPLGRMNDISH